MAGAAALILQAIPGIPPGSVKELLIATAAQSNKPGPHPGYDVGWGFGFLDLFAALRRPPVVNTANTITAQIHNFSATAASNARVCFGVYVFSNNFNRFFELGCQMANLPAGTTPVSLAWTPSPALVPPGLPATDPVHACLKVSIDYPFDSNFANNEMQRNTSVAQASTARVPFRLENNLTKEARVELRAETDSRWQTRITENGREVEPVFNLKPGSCPKNLIVEMVPPPGARKGDKATFVLRALANGKEDFGGIVVDAVVAHEGEAGPGETGGLRPRAWWWLVALLLVFVLLWWWRRKS